MKFAITLLISSSFASLAGAFTTECATKVAQITITWPSDLSDPSTYHDDFCFYQIPTLVTACDGTGDTDDQSTADTYKAYQGMCDDSSTNGIGGTGGGCDKKYANAVKCIEALGDSPTMENVNACCADGVGTLYGQMKAACSGQTTFLGQTCSYEGHTCVWIGEDIETSCTAWTAALDGGGATTAVSGLAIAAAGAAILNVL
mmetsp:Transcript_3127/g.5861  ORF Transcript_3127/g.5861 Transcript_3127/m.5861 type:complete len:202 (+) Transcript_3127:52-657(+)|eukprot:CAMPEP_0182511570 /NCGR_PEP_ID=MMETSP1321-20130603/30716_1 /TAXON_ID=91990 /ORGANISM="Bolidomonas sp., Strain RCC1657" /LENGTH=201 /DNA_ID=CAMNT_0024718239 /DNA_START=363 /DNA_END=968 /DNA_ORIENTATION=+